MSKVRLSFSYPDKMKSKLEKLAKQSGRKLMGYLKLIMNKEANRLREKENG
ncbi:MAG: hypothetical protein GY797_17445 [Deltaproteobacteria bacterium]|nr:hypothetical protein [Deltaproteobacteria bacterium]